MAKADIPAQEPLFKDAVPTRTPSYEEQLALVESLMTCYDTPLTQAAGYTRDLLKTIIALKACKAAVVSPERIEKTIASHYCTCFMTDGFCNSDNRSDCKCRAIARDCVRSLDRLVPNKPRACREHTSAKKGSSRTTMQIIQDLDGYKPYLPYTEAIDEAIAFLGKHGSHGLERKIAADSHVERAKGHIDAAIKLLGAE